MTTDPLAGWRERINTGEVDAVWWLDDGTGKPVETGDVFQLRSCAIEITRVHRAQKGREFIWRAELIRTPRRADPVRLLAVGAGNGHGYVSDDEGAITLEDVDPDVLEVNLGEWPCEPEAVPRDEIDNYTGSKLARARYEHEMEAQRRALDELPIAARVARILEAAENGQPVGREVRAILGKVAAAERKLGLRRVA